MHAHLPSTVHGSTVAIRGPEHRHRMRLCPEPTDQPVVGAASADRREVENRKGCTFPLRQLAKPLTLPSMQEGRVHDHRVAAVQDTLCQLSQPIVRGVIGRL